MRKAESLIKTAQALIAIFLFFVVLGTANSMGSISDFSINAPNEFAAPNNVAVDFCNSLVSTLGMMIAMPAISSLIGLTVIGKVLKVSREKAEGTYNPSKTKIEIAICLVCYMFFFIKFIFPVIIETLF